MAERPDEPTPADSGGGAQAPASKAQIKRCLVCFFAMLFLLLEFCGHSVPETPSHISSVVSPNVRAAISKRLHLQVLCPPE
jgi:hypothetical protein